MNGVHHQVKALVTYQAGDAADNGSVGIALQPRHLLKGGLAVLFALELLGVVCLGKTLVVPGVIALYIDTVQNTADLVRVVGDHPGKAMGVKVIAQLFGIGGGDGGHIVGGTDGTLHQIDVAEVGQHPLVEIAVGQAE